MSVKIKKVAVTHVRQSVYLPQVLRSTRFPKPVNNQNIEAEISLWIIIKQLGSTVLGTICPTEIAYLDTPSYSS